MPTGIYVRKAKLPNTRICRECCIEYPLTTEFFYINCSEALGAKRFKYDCKPCFSRKASLAKQNDVARKIARDRYKLLVLTNSEYKEKQRIKRRRQLLRTYGISFEEFELMLKTQNGKCKICSDSPTSLAIDHNHETGKVRGLLCHPCNKGLGHFRENMLYLSKAIDYLQEN